MANSADPDQLDSLEANRSDSTLFAKAGHNYPDSAGPGLKARSWIEKYQDTLVQQC